MSTKNPLSALVLAGCVFVAWGCGGDGGSTGVSPDPSASMKLAAPSEFGDVSSASADLNGDGFADLAVLTVPADPSDTRPAFVSVYYGPILPGTLPQASEHYDTASSASALTLADLNGDGVPDVIVAQRCTAGSGAVYLGRVHVFFRAAAGGVIGQSDVFLGLDAESVGVADVDGDGSADLLAGGSGYLYLARGLGAGSFEEPTHVPSSGVWTVRNPGGHGGVDLAIARWADPRTVDVYSWNAQMLSVAASLTFTRPVSALEAADIDGDGIEDLLVGTADASSGSFAVALAFGRSSFDPTAETELGPVRRIAVGDFNGDGLPDIGLSGFAADGSVASLLGTGQGTFRSGGRLVPSSPGALQRSADLDGDGKSDLILCDSSARLYFSPGWLQH